MKNAIALGTFDGVHKGHIEVLSLPSECRKVAVTFLHPPKSGEQIMTGEDKCRILKSIGIDEILTLDFQEVKDYSPEKFLEMLYEKYEPAVISCGFNNRFGKNAEGDVNFLEGFCKDKGITLNCVQPVLHNGEVVSSTCIRQLLKEGRVDKANELLYEPFSFETTVLKGDQRGRTIGFPTVNQRYPSELVKLRFGVYKTKIVLADKEYFGITNIGIRPTYKSDYIISETYIKDFSGDLYGKNLRIVPLEFIRDEVKFSSLEELKKQILKDLQV